MRGLGLGHELELGLKKTWLGHVVWRPEWPAGETSLGLGQTKLDLGQVQLGLFFFFFFF